MHPGGSFAQVQVVGPLASFDYIPRHVSPILLDTLSRTDNFDVLE